MLRKFQRADVSQSERAWTDVQSWGGGGGGHHRPISASCYLICPLLLSWQTKESSITVKHKLALVLKERAAALQ